MTPSLASRDWRPMLQAIPLQNQAARLVRDTGSCVSLEVRNKKPGYRIPPLSWFIPYTPFKRIDLDEVGTEIWRQCDGKTTVESICDAFAARYALTFHEARTSVTDYLRQLVKRGILAIAISEPCAP